MSRAALSQRRPALCGILCAVLVSGWPSIVSASDEAILDDLEWLAGHWRGEAGEVVMEEIWTQPRGGVMVGLHRDVFPERPAFFEYLRIEQRDSEVVYIASPRGQGATEFVLISAGPTDVAFENLEHDFPQRILYSREGDRLIARIEGEVSGEARSRQWEWRLQD